MSVKSFKESFDRYATQVLDQSLLPSLYDPIRYMFALGGKRIRPILAMTSFAVFEDDIERVLPACMALEMFHNFSLIHDDIMDASITRRGQASAHVKYGEDAAILSGDTMLTLCYKYLRFQQPDLQKEVVDAFTDMALELCIGQRLDMDFETNSEVSRGDYIEMITGKTAVLMAFSLKIGAMVARADVSIQDQLYDAAKQIGISFQIKDDYLDLYGDPNKIGKLRGGDIRRRKKSFLFVAALEKLEGQSRTEFLELYNTDDSQDRVPSITSKYNTLGIDKTVKQAMSAHYEKGMKILSDLCEYHDVSPIQKLFSTIYQRMH